MRINHSVELVLDTIDPQVTDEMSGEELGITELVHPEATYFYGSSPDRVQNITKAASEFHGLLIAPYETFSMAGAIWGISAWTMGMRKRLLFMGTKPSRVWAEGYARSAPHFSGRFFLPDIPSWSVIRIPTG